MALLVGLFVLSVIVADPVSWVSSRLLSRYVDGITFAVAPGPAPAPAPSARGPFDVRLGYDRVGEMVRRLEGRGFSVTAQARVSDRFHRVADFGLFPPYHEKTHAGLRLIGRDGTVISDTRFPQRVYTDFEEVPGPVRETLLFLENRELLDDAHPYGNPAVEWDRFVAAVANFAGGRILGGGGRFGASTLATQLEKLRHSPDGITRSPGDKARQMASATLRSYLRGPLTGEVRRIILTDYLNALPVGAMPGYGEVIGLRDGLRVWFGLDPDSADLALRTAAAGGPAGAPAARAYRGVLALLLAQRRPTYYLQTAGGREALLRLTDAHLRLIGTVEAVPAELTRAALAAALPVRSEPPSPPAMSFVERKAVNAVRSHLVDLTGAPGLYQLDRYDLTARTTFDGAAQQAATELLRQLADTGFVRSAGLTADRLLGAEDPRQVAYSFVLYEHTPRGNAVRVQVDNLERSFDLNAGARLELGSTAKLRTLVTYLEIVAQLHAELSGPAPDSTTPAWRADDPITLWARAWLAERPATGIAPMLEAALERRYAASPSETFFTGGGAHVFGNFDDTHDREVPTVLEGFRHSINLVFVRLMRDLVRYHEQRIPGYADGLLDDPATPERRAFLERFADAEGRDLVARYYRRHRGLGTDSSLALLLGPRITPQRYARLLLAVAPTTPGDTLAATVARRFPASPLAAAEAQRIRRGMPEHLTLADRAFLAGEDPLELWVIGELRATPDAGLPDLQARGADARLAAYAWLFRNTPSVRRAQDRAIRVMLEREAFEPIRIAWRRLGYPYADLVPSLGSSIGSSGDRPAALAELVGILVADGLRYPVARVEALRFGEGTPFEVALGRDSTGGTRVLAPEVAAVARMALADVVERGTATLLRGAIRRADSTPVTIGGKTGTGENQIKTFAPGGRLLSARTTSRTATFVFYVGSRFYGVATAYVEGPASERFRFTSGLPVRVVSMLLPRLSGLLAETPADPPSPAPRSPRAPDPAAVPPDSGR